MTAYYNEIDPYAAKWLENLIAGGHIAPGIVDTRSIEDVRPSDISGFTQCHFFAGIGVWSYALRRAGWPDTRRVWSGSCPCQPFSAAGSGGGFDDERHLWPAWFQLIAQLRPDVIFGEQVASPDGLSWLNLVQTDLEAAEYATGAVDLCAAGVGAPHIRQRLFFVADTNNAGLEGYRGYERQHDTERRQNAAGYVGQSSVPLDRLADADGAERERGEQFGNSARVTIITDNREADVDGQQRPGGERIGGNEYATPERGQSTTKIAGFYGNIGTSAGNSFWSNADWLGCRDGKLRPVEPGTFPLANGAAARVGRLRAYGNAINAEVAIAFIRAYMECKP